MRLRNGLCRIAIYFLMAAATLSTCQARDAGTVRPVQISLSFNLTMTAEAGARGPLVPAESTRRAFYQHLTSECDLLLATIAATCQLTNANVNVSEQRHNQPMPYVQINGSGTFAVQLKPR